MKLGRIKEGHQTTDEFAGAHVMYEACDGQAVFCWEGEIRMIDLWLIEEIAVPAADGL